MASRAFCTSVWGTIFFSRTVMNESVIRAKPATEQVIRASQSTMPMKPPLATTFTKLMGELLLAAASAALASGASSISCASARPAPAPTSIIPTTTAASNQRLAFDMFMLLVFVHPPTC